MVEHFPVTEGDAGATPVVVASASLSRVVLKWSNQIRQLVSLAQMVERRFEAPGDQVRYLEDTLRHLVVL